MNNSSDSADTTAALIASLAALDGSGQSAALNARLNYAKSLARRLETLQQQNRADRQQQKLREKIASELTYYQQQLEQQPIQKRHSNRATTALSSLLQEINSKRELDNDDTEGQTLQFSLFAASPAPKKSELKALNKIRKFRQLSNRKKRIHRAIHHTPSDAGPLNAHRQVSQSIETLEQSAPEYVAHLLNYVDTLIALEALAKSNGINKKNKKDSK